MQNDQYQWLVGKLYFRIETLVNNAAALERDLKVKDGAIQNLNAGLMWKRWPWKKSRRFKSCK